MDSWAVRVLTVAIVFQLLSSVMLFQNLWDTQHQLERGRAERNTQVCLLIRDQIKDARAIMEAGC
jgi:hypothetical protein